MNDRLDFIATEFIRLILDILDGLAICLLLVKIELFLLVARVTWLLRGWFGYNRRKALCRLI